jgi:hypothetical protein
MDKAMIENVREMDKAVTFCFGQPTDNELPQIACADAAFLDLYQETTGLPRDKAQAQLSEKQQTNE